MPRGFATKNVIITPEMLAPLGLAPARERLPDPAMAYAKVPLIFRAARIRCNSLLKLPRHLYHDDGTTEADWPFDYPLPKLLWRTRASGLLSGAGYILKRSNSVTVKELQYLNPTTMRVTYDPNTDSYEFTQSVGSKTQTWSDAEMCYIPEFTLRSDYEPGDAPATVAMGNAQLSYYITRMAARFFEDGAMPITLVTSEDGFGADVDKVQNFFERQMQGLRNAWRTLAVRGRGISVNQLQSRMKDLALPDLRDQARKDVALAFEIPESLMDDAANYATAKEQKRSFYDETVVPDAELFAEELNSQIFDSLDLHFEFAPQEMDLYQEDEGARAQAFGYYVNAGMDIEVAAAVLGVNIPEAVLPIWQADLAKRRAGVPQDTLAQVRPSPVHPDKGAEGDNTNADMQPAPAKTVSPRPSFKSDLEKWERAAVKRVKRGGSLDFESVLIPHTLKASILGALESARDAATVKRIFTDAQRWGLYP